MPWPTIATDGFAFGRLGFLEDYESNPDGKYKVVDAKIIGIRDSEIPWEDYNFEVEGAGTNLRLRRSLRPTFNLAFRVQDSETNPEEIPIKAYIEKKMLVGFTPLED